LLKKSRNTVLVTTNDIGLIAFFKKENYEWYHFSEIIKRNNLFLDYTFKEGKLTNRNAIRILDLYQYPSEIMKTAKEIEKLISLE
jgi:DNA mismatch repair ATPase MutS|tara:strand:- start:67 stop:321 length:255 start_codon:yes stop_codon:yes gene_type:complete